MTKKAAGTAAWAELHSRPMCWSRRCTCRAASSPSAGGPSNWLARAASPWRPERPGTGKPRRCAFSPNALARSATSKSASSPGRKPAFLDFYREMGDLFSVELRPANRWGGAKLLRDRWQTHIDAALSRPVSAIVDEAQEMLPAVIAELRLLVVGQVRRQPYPPAPSLRRRWPLASNASLRSWTSRRAAHQPHARALALERSTPDELSELIVYAPQKAGAVKLMTPELIATLADHAQGNPRALMNIAGELLSVAAQREARHIDEKLFLELCAAPPVPAPRRQGSGDDLAAGRARLAVSPSAPRNTDGWSPGSGPIRPSASLAASPNAASRSSPSISPWPSHRARRACAGSPCHAPAVCCCSLPRTPCTSCAGAWKASAPQRVGARRPRYPGHHRAHPAPRSRRRPEEPR